MLTLAELEGEVERVNAGISESYFDTREAQSELILATGLYKEYVAKHGNDSKHVILGVLARSLTLATWYDVIVKSFDYREANLFIGYDETVVSLLESILSKEKEE